MVMKKNTLTALAQEWGITEQALYGYRKRNPDKWRYIEAGRTLINKEWNKVLASLPKEDLQSIRNEAIRLLDNEQN